jgi:hypothetical protein
MRTVDRDRLQGYLERGLSLNQIGELEKRHPSTVGYWVRKHGLTANGRDKYSPQGGLNRGQLEALVKAGATLDEIASTVARSERTVRDWLARYGLSTNGRSGRRPIVRREVVEQAIAAGTRTITAECHRHGETEFAIVGSEHLARCKACRAEAVARRRRRVKEILVEEAGGSCHLCGYDRCIAALHFHHRDPSTKTFGVAARGITRAIEQVRAEVEKCVLLCSNCHAEVEAGVATLT